MAKENDFFFPLEDFDGSRTPHRRRYGSERDLPKGIGYDSSVGEGGV